jgi:RcsF protein
MMKYFPLLALLLSGCSNYPLHTNLDKENFTNYFAVSEVNYYDADGLGGYLVEQLGVVEGESCQAAPNQPPATKQIAMIAAKRRAAERQANGVIIRSCIELPSSNACYTGFLCYADAIKVTSLRGDDNTAQKQ